MHATGPDDTPARALALECLTAGIEAAHPGAVADRTLALTDDVLTVTPPETVGGDARQYDLSAYERVLVLGAGNAAGHLAAALEDLLGDRVAGGLVVTDDPVDCDRIEVVAGDHPVPTERNVAAAERLLDLADRATAEDLVLAPITGGGSALLAAPAGDVRLDDLRTTTEALLASGAPIDDVNAVRKHLSAVKGGRLARAAAPATVVGLAVSDVVGDDRSVIASGPLSPDPSTYDDALAVLDRHGVAVPDAVRARLEAGARGEVTETPAPGDPAFDRVDVVVLANGWTAIAAAREVARERGFTPVVLASGVEGEAREVGRVHAAVAREALVTGNPVEPPAVLLSGGEATVTLPEDHGAGGPNQEFALAAALALDGDPVTVGAVDTDGIDGVSDAAGAILDGDVDDAGADALAAHDVEPFLDAADALVHTGHTGTNVNDLRVLVVPQPRP